MFDLSELPLPGTGWLTWDVLAVVGLSAVALIVLALLVGRRSTPRVWTPVMEPRSASEVPAGYDPFTQGSTREQRVAPRRSGNPIAVHVSSADGRREPVTGLVLDRSLGGLRLFLDNRVAVGTILSVRPSEAPRTTPWVHVEVRYCREVAHHFEAGCQYVRTPSWGVLVLFG